MHDKTNDQKSVAIKELLSKADRCNQQGNIAGVIQCCTQINQIRSAPASEAPNKPHKRPRRRGVVTAVCASCQTPNGVGLGLHYHDQAALYRCHNPECRTANRVTIVSNTVHMREDYMGSVQNGVKVGGVEPRGN